MDLNELTELISKAEAVSFDIFDTLIVRLYRRPTDLFRHLEFMTSKTGFCTARIEAESAARQKAEKDERHEVTLEEIYSFLHPEYQTLMEQELELELTMCKQNPEMKAVYDTLIQSGIPVYICSDMYLPEDIIKRILNQAGYNQYKQLLLSSSILRPKATGEMYQDLIALSDIPANKILHIGDHPYTDGEVAEREGLQFFVYDPPKKALGDDRNSQFFSVLNRYIDKDVTVSVLEGMITHRAAEGEHDYWEDFGYRYVGLAAYGYAKWLSAQLKNEGIKQVVSFLRDGYIFGRVLQLLDPSLEVQEMYASRRLFVFASAEKYEDISDYLVNWQLIGKSYRDAFQQLVLDDNELAAAYSECFPDQNATIQKKDLSALHVFWKDHWNLLSRIGESERKTIFEYLDNEHFFDNNTSACIDLGWKGSLLRLLLHAGKLAGRQINLTGYYFGTHACDSTGLRLIGYLLDHGRSTGASNADVLLDYGFTIQLLELAFTAPMYSVLKLTKDETGIRPVFQNPNRFEAKRIEVSKRIAAGAIAFAAEMKAIEEKSLLPFSKDAVLAPIEYLSREISPLDAAALETVSFAGGLSGDSDYRPIFCQGHPAIGIINPWPGDMSAEAEVLTRFRRAAEENQIECVYLDGFGHVLNRDNQTATKDYVDAKKLSFAISTHYETSKILDAFHYHTLWNPPEIPLNLDYYTDRVTDNYIMNDDFLIYDSGGMSNHLRSMLMNCPRTLDGASSLTASFPKSAMLEPKLDEPTMFYCGMNWEKTVSGTNRHEGLFKLLDGTGNVKFFGPERVEAWGGLKPWEGYKCYQHSIPFDGFSILKEINDCGICLVLSSDIHRRAGSATNRTYEACAAGAVIISDDNEFMLRNFKDAALFITYNRNNPGDTFRQIMEKYDWIMSHKDEALGLARKAQEIFKERFCLDVQLQTILENHPARREQIKRDLYATDNSEKVLATLVINSQSIKEARRIVDQVVKSVHAQIYPYIELGIAADQAVAGDIMTYLETRCACAKVIPMQLFDKKGARQMTDGQAIRSLQKRIWHTYYINTNPNEIWFSDHITTLVRALQASGMMCAYSGTAFEDINGYRHINCFDRIGIEHLYYFKKPERALCAGQMLFSAKAHVFLPDYLFDDLDGMEHNTYAAILLYRCGERLIFTHRMSLVFTENFSEVGHSVLPVPMQTRFIKDLVRYYLPENTESVSVEGADSATLSADVSKSITDMMLMFPIRSYLRLRYYRIRLRKLPANGEKYARIQEKYDAALAEFTRSWRI